MWAGTRVLVTGASGFLGRHLVDALEARGAVVLTPGRADIDLCDLAATCRGFMELQPAVVIHAAVQGGGIGWMREHPVESGRDNALLNLNSLDAAWRAGAHTYVGVSSACCYPRICPVPFVEDDLWKGRPEPTNEAYAQSKRLLLSLGEAYQAQHGIRVVAPVLANLYGPGDHLSPTRAHVVAALLQRVVAAPEELLVWGTGRATREFLFVRDASEGILVAAERWPGPAPLNIGTGIEVPIAQLAHSIAAAADYGGPIRFDTSKPDGQPRKCLDVSRATEALGWTAPTSLETGLRETVAWYRAQLAAGAEA